MMILPLKHWSFSSPMLGIIRGCLFCFFNSLFIDWTASYFTDSMCAIVFSVHVIPLSTSHILGAGILQIISGLTELFFGLKRKKPCCLAPTSRRESFKVKNIDPITPAHSNGEARVKKNQIEPSLCRSRGNVAHKFISVPIIGRANSSWAERRKSCAPLFSPQNSDAFEILKN